MFADLLVSSTIVVSAVVTARFLGAEIAHTVRTARLDRAEPAPIPAPRKVYIGPRQYRASARVHTLDSGNRSARWIPTIQVYEHGQFIREIQGKPGPELPHFEGMRAAVAHSVSVVERLRKARG
jgi:hypothetical protein